jgi:hypothetical protein
MRRKEREPREAGRLETHKAQFRSGDVIYKLVGHF